jgi:TPP-dependent 2-oxoacid decarboxylase
MPPVSVRSVLHRLLPDHAAVSHLQAVVPVAQPKAAVPEAAAAKTISRYLLERLHAYGVRHIFGIPGDYSIGFYKAITRSGLLEAVNTCDEQGAGFAADAYARTVGLGACCLTYAVGGLKAVNTTAEAYAEKSPVVIISGAPGVGERLRGPHLHHIVRDFDSQLKVYQEVTVACTVLENPATAFSEIDRVLSAALRYKRPVYIEIPRDMFNVAGEPEHIPTAFHLPVSNPDALQEAVREAVALIEASEKPVIMADVEVKRFGLEHTLLRLVEATNIPFVTTVLSKGMLSERHPLFLGVYQGALSHTATREYVESSDCVIMLGAMMTDINLGLFTASIDPARSIYVSSEKAAIFHHAFEQVTMDGFVDGLTAANLTRRNADGLPHPDAPAPFVPDAGKTLSVPRLFEAINAFVDDDTAVVADTGESLYFSGDLLIHNEAEYYSPGYYTSVGFAVPAALGAQLGDRRKRPLVLVGDGAFQMTGVELSSIVRAGLNPIVVVFNNGGYGTERPLDSGPHVELLRWNYARFVDVLQAGRSFVVRTEDELSAALQQARAADDQFSLLDVHLASGDYSAAFERFLALFAKGV